MTKITFKDLTPENIEYIKHVYYQEMLHVEKMEILSKKFNVNERTVRGWWQKLDLSKLSTNLSPQLQKAHPQTSAAVANRRVPTWLSLAVQFAGTKPLTTQ